MKKCGLVAVVGSICLLFLFTHPSVAQVIKLTWSDQNPQMGWGPVHANQPWFKKIEEVTHGRVKIEPYWSQTLAKGPDNWNAIKTGVADMGWCVHGYWADMTPLSDVTNLPALGFKTGEKGSEILWRLYDKFPEFKKQYKDVHMLILHTSAPYFLITTKKQVKTLEDIKGLKLRVLGGVATEQMKALGAIPVLIPMPDTYLSMDKGVIDGMAAPWEATDSFRFYEVAKYYTMVPLSGAGVDSVPINKQKWDSLPKDIQQAIMSVSGLEGSKFWGRNFFDAAEQGVLEKVKQGNHTMVRYTPPPEELQRWVKASEPIWKEWVKRTETKGYSSAQQVLDAALQMSRE
jgi:TRAP-type transport system periplasmic protein